MQYIQYNIAAGKITRLGLYACIVLYYITGKVWGLSNMLTLQQATVQRHTTDKANSKKIFSHNQTIILALFQLKTFTPSTTCIGKRD